MFSRAAAASFAVLALVVVLVSGASARPMDAPPHIATFNGGQIDLSQGWGDAHACFIDQTAGLAECFATQSELRAREAQLGLESPSSVTPLVSCGSPLRLYADASYGGRELDFYDRGYWQNLSTWSFDNQTSSYQVGACSVDLADGANGGGSWYPGNTSAGHNEPTMQSGWSDRVSSIYIQ